MASRGFLSEVELGVISFFVGTCTFNYNTQLAARETYPADYVNSQAKQLTPSRDNTPTPYSIKQPDAAWGVDGELIPTMMTVEVRWGGLSHIAGYAGMGIRVWMEGSGGRTRVSFVVKMTRRAGGGNGRLYGGCKAVAWGRVGLGR